MSSEDTRPKPSVAKWLAGGALAGALLSAALLLPELVRRLAHASRGGGGETADWGEPVFFMVLLGCPGALFGALGGVAGWGIALARRRAAPPRQDGP